MRNLIIGFVSGVLLTAALAYASVNDRIQQEIGQLIVANAQLQDQLETVTKSLDNCKAHAPKVK